VSTFKELYQYRQMINSLVRQDLRSRYKGSVLGFLWTFINPLLQLIIYTIVFSTIMKNGIDKYYIFLFVALIPWLFFSSSVSGGAASILNKKELVKKIYFPRQVLPIAYVTSSFVNMLLCFVVVFAVLVISGVGISLAVCFLPIVMLVEYILALGIAMLVSALTVYFRDLEYILGIVTMAWMYMTPIMYSNEMVPEEYRSIFKLNPMTPVITVYRDILYYKQIPRLDILIQTVMIGIAFLIAGNIIFKHLQKGFAEVI
jgi:lipopolysaccharide transport system permease protein